MPPDITPEEINSRRGLRRSRRTRLALALIGGCLGAAVLLPATGLGQVSPEVVGGSEPASIAEFPFQVALYDPLVDANPANSQFCGAVIIDATHVITAAHCVLDEASGQASSPEEIEVLAGTANLDTEAQPNSGEYVEDPVAVTSFDPQWNPGSGEHDLGVLTLARPLWSGSTPALDGTNTIAPVSLLEPAEASYATPGGEATVSGWGDTHAETLEAVRPSYPTKLNDARLTLLSNGTCAKQLELSEPLGPDFVCAGALGRDACYGDSGGPLVVRTGVTLPADYRLLGTVDLGFGCAVQGNPGIYQSVVADENAAFVQSSPPQAPLLGATAPSLTGTAQPGATLSCGAGSWSGAPTLEFFYGFDSDESAITGFKSSSLTTQLSSRATFTVPPQTQPGTRIFCEVGVEDDGGWAEALSPDITVTSAPQPAPMTASSPPPSETTTLPTLRVVSETCQKDGHCAVNVIASAGSGQAAVTKIGVTLKNVPCAKHARHDICTRSPDHAPSVKSMPARHFLISTRGLSPGKYTLTLTAVDLAGIRQKTPTRVSLTVAPSRKKTGSRA